MNEDKLDRLFFPGESPYLAMFQAGVLAIPLEDVLNKLASVGIQPREKDIANWANGYYRGHVQTRIESNPLNPKLIRIFDDFETKKLSEYPQYPIQWTPPSKRFIPCNQEGKPMVAWGYKENFTPQLYTREEALEISPCNWIGQNMLYQRFIVVDIDGTGHGVTDESTIRFGEYFKQYTLTFEDPNKPGSFHLYFHTDRIVPVKHFPHAKIDMMGNAVNAAVYFKNKQPNGKQMAELTDEIFEAIKAYQKKRKELRYG